MAPFPTARDAARAAIAEVVDLIAVDGLPDDPIERRDILRLAAQSDTFVPTHCPETGRDLAGIDIVAHAQNVYPPSVPAGAMSPQALEREAALYRAAGVKAPVRR